MNPTMASSFMKIKLISPSAPLKLESHFKPKARIHIESSKKSPSTKPPSSKQEAILQAKTSISTALQKRINKGRQFTVGKMKKEKQPRFRVEIPVMEDIDESETIVSVAFEIFGDMSINSTTKLLMVWPNQRLKESGIKAFEQSQHKHIDLTSADDVRILMSGDVAVILAPEESQLKSIRAVSENLDPRPVVLFNPRWSFEEEAKFNGDLQRFVDSFNVVYAFFGFQVRGLFLSKRNGVVFRCGEDDGGGDTWNLLVDDEEKEGEFKVVSKFKSRPSIDEVENLLYTLVAANSPVTKSVKFFRNLVSNFTGNK